MNEWIILLLPFLVIGVGGVVAGVIALRARRRTMRRTRPVAPDPEPDWWQDVPLHPIAERPVDTPYPPESWR